jgi:hypothetical protein
MQCLNDALVLFSSPSHVCHPQFWGVECTFIPQPLAFKTGTSYSCWLLTVVTSTGLTYYLIVWTSHLMLCVAAVGQWSAWWRGGRGGREGFADWAAVRRVAYSCRIVILQEWTNEAERNDRRQMYLLLCFVWQCSCNEMSAKNVSNGVQKSTRSRKWVAKKRCFIVWFVL